MGSCSNASFGASTQDCGGQDVDLDDPDFWEKSVGLEAPYDSIGQEVTKAFFEKIIHKKVKVYDQYAEFSEVYPEPAILLLLDGTSLNEIMRLISIFTIIFECYFLFISFIDRAE